MRFLFDLLPVILFFAAYRWAGTDAAVAAQLLGDLGLTGIGERLAPILLATCVAIVATIGQVGGLLALRRRVDTMLWVSLALIVVMGGLTLWLQDPAFIMWKPTLLYWTFATTLAGSAWLLRRNLIQTLMGEQLQLPPAVWARLNLAWVVFFAVMGALNLYVARHFDEATWVSFKLYGGIGLMLLFVAAQGVWLSRHLPAASDP
ncbi:MAG: septation protein A [Betaproteobacteria bacterium]|jgi:intracellular septation protein|nr:septation protein A [Betaproteobacteria bacterium]